MHNGQGGEISSPNGGRYHNPRHPSPYAADPMFIMYHLLFILGEFI